MPSFTFGPNQLYIAILCALLFALVCAIIWYLKKHCGASEEEKAGLNRVRHVIGFLMLLVTAAAVFLTSQEQGADPRSIKSHKHPDPFVITPRSVIEENNAQKAAERRQARREEIQSTTEELEEDSVNFFDKLMERERALREAESKPDK